MGTKRFGTCVIGLAAMVAATPASANGADFAMGMLGGAVGMALAQQGAYAAYPRYGYVRYRYARHVHQSHRIIRAAALKAEGTGRRPVQVPVESVTLARDQAKLLRVVWDCRGGNTTTAEALRGSVRARPSTRFVCGDPDHPVTEFVYLSEPGTVAPDVVTFRQNGRDKSISNVFVNDAVPPPATAPHPMRMVSGREVSVWRFWSCDPSAWDVALSVGAGGGTATVRTATAAVCGRADYPVKEVFYRPMDGFAGTDLLVMKSNIAAPVSLPITVDAAPPTASAPPREVPPPPTPVVAAPPAGAGAPGVERARVDGDDCGCGYLSVDGSLVRSHEDGHNLTIRYVEPAPATAARGVKAGTVLFEGMILPDGGIGGRAYDHKAGCEAAPYAVLGGGDGTKLTLWGDKPVWKGCVATTPRSDAPGLALVFTKASAPSARSPARRAATPPGAEREVAAARTNG